jgi:hypothetical protein
MGGKGRFELAHDTPKGIKRDIKFPPITMPNGNVITNYTITLTFRRAADLNASTPIAPVKLETSNVEITKTNYTKDTAPSNPTTGFIFTENAEMLDTSKNVSMTQAIIRTTKDGLKNLNALPIITKKLQISGGQWSNSEEDFSEFKRLNTMLIERHLSDNWNKLVFPQGFATDKAQLPTRFAEWLQKELLDNFGLVTELNETKSGLISKSVVNNLQLPKLKNTDIKVEPSPDAKSIDELFEDNTELGSTIINNFNDNISSENSSNQTTNWKSIQSSLELLQESDNSIGFRMVGGTTNNGSFSYNGKEYSSEYLQRLFNRNLKDLQDSNKTTEDEKRIYVSYRFARSLQNNKLNSRVAKKLGVKGIELTNNINSNFGVSATNKGTIKINLANISNVLYAENFDKYIDYAMFEELIHLVTFKELPQSSQKNSFREYLSEKDYKKSTDTIYGFIDNPFLSLLETVRLQVQRELLGNYTEEYSGNLRKLTAEVIENVLKWFTKLFNLSYSKEIKDIVKNYINENNTIDVKVEFEENIKNLPDCI